MQDKMDDNNPLLPGDLPEATPIARWVPAAVVIAVLLGFTTLTWYAYHAGVQSLKEDDLMVVEADKKPVKEKPADPGGMQFPDQDKTVFDTFSNNPQPAKVERVVPSPEEPVKTDTSGTTTWVNDKLQDGDKPSVPEQVIGDQKPQATPIPKQDEAPAVVTYSAKDAAAPAAPVPEKKTAPVVQKAPEKTPEKTVVAEKAAAKPAAVKAGAYKVQLGAYRSEKEARDAWGKMAKKYDELAGHAPVIVKADLGDRGIYFRLRASGFASADEAKTFCKKLTASGQACMLPVN